MVNGCPSKTASVTVTVLPCAGVNELAESREVFNVYPNPNTGQFTIQADTEIELKLFNALGQLIRNLKLETLNNYKADVVDLSSGVYLISGKKNNKYYNMKIVVAE